MVSVYGVCVKRVKGRGLGVQMGAWGCAGVDRKPSMWSGVIWSWRVPLYSFYTATNVHSTIRQVLQIIHTSLAIEILS